MNQSKLDQLLFTAILNENYKDCASLLDQGANPNQLFDKHGGISPFHIAVGLDNGLAFTELFIRHRADLNLKSSENGWTPLHVAACWNKPDSLRLLLLNKADPFSLDKNGQTPLDVAMENGSEECVSILRELNSNQRGKVMNSGIADAYDELKVYSQGGDKPSLLTMSRQTSLASITSLESLSGASFTNFRTSTFDDESKFEYQLAAEARQSSSKLPPPASKPPDTPFMAPPVPQRPNQAKTTPLKAALAPNKQYQSPLSASDKQELEEIISNLIDLKLEQQEQRIRQNSSVSSTINASKTPTSLSDSRKIIPPNKNSLIQLPPTPPPLPSSLFSSHVNKSNKVDRETQTTGKCVRLNAELASSLSNNQQVQSLPANLIEELSSKLSSKQAARANREDTATPVNKPRLNSAGNSASSVTNTSLNGRIRSWLSNRLLGSQTDTKPKNSGAETSSSAKLNLSSRIRSTSVGSLLFNGSQSKPAGRKYAGILSPSPVRQQLPKESVKARSASASNTRTTKTANATSKPIQSNMFTPPVSQRQQHSIGSPSSARSVLYSNAAVRKHVNQLNNKQTPSKPTPTITQFSPNTRRIEEEQIKKSHEVLNQLGQNFFRSVFGNEKVSQEASARCSYSPQTNHRAVRDNLISTDTLNPRQMDGMITNDESDLAGCLEESDSDRTLYDAEEIVAPIKATNKTYNNYTFKTADDNFNDYLHMLSANENETVARRELVDEYGYSEELADEIAGPGLDLTTTSDIMISNMNGCFQQQTCLNPISKQIEVIRWREGNAKSAFNYLLIDPRISLNLPSRAKSSSMSERDVFRVFCSAVFYVGKGSRARPYAHLQESLAYWNKEYATKKLGAAAVAEQTKKKITKKIDRIVQVWNENYGVVSLHCFQSVIPSEAYTREAAMIDALGLKHLCNVKKGNYYGEAQDWSTEKKKQLGVILLKRACSIFMAEGETQIRPYDLIK